MRDIALKLSDQIDTLSDGVSLPCAPRSITWVRDALTMPTRSEFLNSHRLLLSQVLALTGSWSNTVTDQARLVSG